MIYVCIYKYNTIYRYTQEKIYLYKCTNNYIETRIRYTGYFHMIHRVLDPSKMEIHTYTYICVCMCVYMCVYVCVCVCVCVHWVPNPSEMECKQWVGCSVARVAEEIANSSVSCTPPIQCVYRPRRGLGSHTHTHTHLHTDAYTYKHTHLTTGDTDKDNLCTIC